MIPALAEWMRMLGLGTAFVPLVFAVLLTGMVFLVPAVFRWFADRKS